MAWLYIAKSIIQKKRLKRTNNMKQYKQLVLVEFRNCSPLLYEFVSYRAITLEKVVQHFIDTEDFNEQKDSITFVDEITEVTI